MISDGEHQEMSHYEAKTNEEVMKFMQQEKPDIFHFYTRRDLETYELIYGVEYLKVNRK